VGYINDKRFHPDIILSYECKDSSYIINVKLTFYCKDDWVFGIYLVVKKMNHMQTYIEMDYTLDIL